MSSEGSGEVGWSGPISPPGLAVEEEFEDRSASLAQTKTGVESVAEVNKEILYCVKPECQGSISKPPSTLMDRSTPAFAIHYSVNRHFHKI
jgi:hypothetical protein